MTFFLLIPLVTPASRHSFRAPGSSAIQPSIIHTSLLRILSPRQLTDATKTAVSHLCKELTKKLKGTKYTPGGVWLVHEEFFSCIEGPKWSLNYPGAK